MAEQDFENLDELMTIRCVWCGWKGMVRDLDMNEHDVPCWCPECGHGSFDIKVERDDKA